MSLNLNASTIPIDQFLAFDWRCNNDVIYENDTVSINRVGIRSGETGAFYHQLAGGVTIVEQEAKLIASFSNQLIRGMAQQVNIKESVNGIRPIALQKFPVFFNESDCDFLGTQISPKSDCLAKVSHITIDSEEIIASKSIQKFIVGNVGTSLKIYRLLSNGAKLEIGTLDGNKSRCPIWRLDSRKGKYVIQSNKRKESACIVDIIVSSKL